jgi:hypothetical protein
VRLKRWLFPWILPLLTGLSLRTFFVLHFPTVTEDGRIYESLANAWWTRHIYGLVADGRLIPVDIRVPGYPALILFASHILGRGQTALMFTQVVMDLAACVLAALLAARLVPEAETPPQTAANRRRVRAAALWIACLCPFLANYCAGELAEVPATFFIAFALVFFSAAFFEPESRRGLWLWFWGGFVTAVGTLFRPETPLLLVALALVCFWRWRHRFNWSRLVRAGVLTFCGLVLPLLPWTLRNAVSLHEFRFLAARYANEPGDFVPTGFFAWTKTWMVRYRYCYIVIWTLGEDRIPLDQIPADAYDNDAERSRVAVLINAYNANCCNPPTPDWDAQFAQLARERTRRDPFRTYLRIPIERAFVLWFTPRIELLPYSGDLWPPGEAHDDDPKDFDITLSLWIIGFIYGGMALAGLIIALKRLEGDRASPQFYVLAFIVTYCLVRTAYLSRLETPEPRYVLECFPVVFALAAQVFSPRIQRSSTGSG